MLGLLGLLSPLATACGGGTAALSPLPTADIVTTTVSTAPPPTVPPPSAAPAGGADGTTAASPSGSGGPSSTVDASTATDAGEDSGDDEDTETVSDDGESGSEDGSEDGAASSTTAAGATSTYTVRDGDTLYSIASRLGVPVDSLARMNGLSDPSRIRVGQALTVPDTAATG